MKHLSITDVTDVGVSCEADSVVLRVRTATGVQLVSLSGGLSIRDLLLELHSEVTAAGRALERAEAVAAAERHAARGGLSHLDLDDYLDATTDYGDDDDAHPEPPDDTDQTVDEVDNHVEPVRCACCGEQNGSMSERCWNCGHWLTCCV